MTIDGEAGVRERAHADKSVSAATSKTPTVGRRVVTAGPADAPGASALGSVVTSSTSTAPCGPFLVYGSRYV